jgi:hypothetical protein
MSKHTDFILSPVGNILRDVIAANKGIGKGIETYPLSEYILQSAFLKMTGAQEQKMKCICWELATDDYEYRYLRFTQSRLGECSTYPEKKEIYIDLINGIKREQPGFNITTELDRNAIASSTISEINNMFSNSTLSTWAEQSFLEFISNGAILPTNQFATASQLFESVLFARYKLLYNHRNRCAHNTLSYQENLPTLKTLLKADHQYDNYFVRFALLILIDKVFIALYQKYLILIGEN